MPQNASENSQCVVYLPPYSLATNKTAILRFVAGGFVFILTTARSLSVKITLSTLDQKQKMVTQHILIDHDSPYILPPCVQDYLPEDQIVSPVFAVDIVDQLGLRALSERNIPLSPGDAVGVGYLQNAEASFNAALWILRIGGRG